MANMHVSEIGRPIGPPPLEIETNPVAETSAMLLRGQAFTGATGVGLLVREDEWLVCRAATGTGAPEFGARIPMEGTFFGLCARSKKPERTEDADTDLRVENANYGRVKPKSILAVPVRSGGDVVGVLAVFSTSGSAFNNTHVAILRTMSDSLVRIIPQLPPMPPPTVDGPSPEPQKKRAPEAVITMPAPIPTPPALVVTSAAPASAPEPRVLRMPEPAPPEPERKADSQLLTLADDPGPRVTLRTLPPLETAPRITYAPSFELPRPRRRYRRMRNRMIAGAVAALLIATFAYGTYATRSQPQPTVASKQPAVPEAFKEQVSAVQAAQAKAATASAPATVSAKEAAIAATPVVAAVVASTPEPVRTPSITEAVKPLSKSMKVADVEAPQLALETGPAMAAMPALGLNAPKPELRQSQVTPAQLVQKVAPEYPIAALRTKASGEVKLTATIRKDGSVGVVKVISGNPMLRDSAVQAVKQWRYYPGTLDGHAIESTAEIVLRFAAPN